MHRLIQFYKENNRSGIKRYVSKLVKTGLALNYGSYDKESLEGLFKKNMDSIAKIADYFIMQKDLGKALDRFIFDPLPTYDCIIGPIRQFYRKAVGYRPVEPSLN